MRLLAAFFRRHPSLFGDTHPAAEPPPVLRSRGVELAASCFPQHRPQLPARISPLGRGLPAAAGGQSPAETRLAEQQGTKEQPAHPRLISCRIYSPQSFLVQALRGGEPVPPTHPIAVRKQKPRGRAEGVPVFDLSICRCYGHGRHFSKPDKGVSVRIWFQQPAASKEES